MSLSASVSALRQPVATTSIASGDAVPLRVLVADDLMPATDVEGAAVKRHAERVVVALLVVKGDDRVLAVRVAQQMKPAVVAAREESAIRA